MDIVTWFETYTLNIFVVSCAVLILMLLLRKIGLESVIDKYAKKYADGKIKRIKGVNPKLKNEEIFKDNAYNDAKSLLSLPYAVLSVLCLITLILSLIVIWMAQQGEKAVTSEVITNWLSTIGLIIVIILTVAYLLTAMIKIIIPKIIHNILANRNRRNKKTDDEEFVKRSKTISNVLCSTINAIVWIVTICIILSWIGLDITPLLASAGVVGIAISLGAQSLIKDIISGFFILLEGHYNEGDYITIAGVSGTVTDINFRRTCLRSTDGILYSIPNGQISIASNFTNSVSKVYFSVPVSYNSDLDLAEKIINEVGMDLANNSVFSSQIKRPIKFVRVDKFDDSGINMLVSGDVKPGAQWAIGGEFRKRLKKAFDIAGVEIPYSHANVIIEGNPNAPGVNINMPNCPHCGKPLTENETDSEQE